MALRKPRRATTVTNTVHVAAYSGATAFGGVQRGDIIPVGHPLFDTLNLVEFTPPAVTVDGSTDVVVAVHSFMSDRFVHRGDAFAAADPFVARFPDLFRAWSPPRLEVPA